jgi:nucleoid DNA-binding protein
MDVGKYIKELLMLHDCVILPALGGFVANYRSAEINEKLKIISPPSKSILFNRSIYHNDGLLIGHISAKTGMNYKDAERMVQEYTEKISRSTGSGNQFRIDELGFFFMDKQKRIQFQSEPGMNFLIESYSLSDVHFSEFFSQTEKSVRSRVYVSQEDIGRRRRKTVRALIYTGIAASLLAAAILIPVKTGLINYTDLRIFRIKGNSSPSIVQSTGIPINEKVQETKTVPLNIEIKPFEFHIIAGSFREFGNARELMKMLEARGFTPRILTGGEYFRVSAGTYTDKENATLALSEIRKMDGMDSAWLLKD